jgi:hypothetical protein
MNRPRKRDGCFVWKERLVNGCGDNSEVLVCSKRPIAPTVDGNGKAIQVRKQKIVQKRLDCGVEQEQDLRLDRAEVAALFQRKDPAREPRECAICYSETVATRLDSCGHQVMCVGCTKQIISVSGGRSGGSKCPFCRATFDGYLCSARFGYCDEFTAAYAWTAVQQNGDVRVASEWDPKSTARPPPPTPTPTPTPPTPHGPVVPLFMEDLADDDEEMEEEEFSLADARAGAVGQIL